MGRCFEDKYNENSRVGQDSQQFDQYSARLEPAYEQEQPEQYRRSRGAGRVSAVDEPVRAPRVYSGKIRISVREEIDAAHRKCSGKQQQRKNDKYHLRDGRCGFALNIADKQHYPAYYRDRDQSVARNQRIERGARNELCKRTNPRFCKYQLQRREIIALRARIRGSVHSVKRVLKICRCLHVNKEHETRCKQERYVRDRGYPAYDPDEQHCEHHGEHDHHSSGMRHIRIHRKHGQYYREPYSPAFVLFGKSRLDSLCAQRPKLQQQP